MPTYRVEFAHEDENAHEAVRHGKGSMEISTDLPIESDDSTTYKQRTYEVARAIGQELGKTKIAILSIVPIGEVGKVSIDYADDGGLLDQATRKILEDPSVYDISSLPKDSK